jgi:cation diffusion facilitator family transporter
MTATIPGLGSCRLFGGMIARIWEEPQAGLVKRRAVFHTEEVPMAATVQKRPAATSNSGNLLLGKRLAAISIVASCVLSISNVWVGYAAGSTSVVAAGFEFLGDVLASVLVLAGMTLAARPADAEHPYGHGRIEILAGLSVGLILAAGGVGICFRSLQKITEQHPPPDLYSMWPLLGAIAIRTGMSTLKFRVGHRIGSASLLADAWNDAVDILSAAAALSALGLTLYDPARFLPADHYGGFAVGLFVIYTGVRVLRETSLDLIDTMPPPELIERIKATALHVDGVKGIEKCHARKTGLQHHVDLHVEVDPCISVADSHDIATNVGAHIREIVPEIADVLVHIEPAGLGDS